MPPRGKPAAIPAAPGPGAVELSPETHPHHFQVPLWAVIALFLVVEIALILVVYGYGNYRYRTVIRSARLAMAENRWQDALQYWAQHVNNYPGAESAIPFRRDRARCYIGLGNYQAALQDLQFILSRQEQGKKDLEVLVDLAECQAKLARTDDARKTYETVLSIEPGNADAHLFLGRQLLDKGQILEAAIHLQAVPVEKYPEDLKARWVPYEERFAREAARLAGPEVSSPTLSAPITGPASGADRPASPSLAPTPDPAPAP